MQCKFNIEIKKKKIGKFSNHENTLKLASCVIYNKFYRFPIAVKNPRNLSTDQIEIFLDETKSMLELGTYHDHIVNLQGISLLLDNENKKLMKVKDSEIAT